MTYDGARGAVVALTAGALVVVAAGAGLAAVAAHQLSDSQQSTSSTDRALAAARQLAVDVAAYDYRHLQQDFDRVTSESTGAFKSQFSKDAAGVQDLVIKTKSVSTAEVAGSAVVEASPDEVSTLIAVNRSVQNSGTTQPRSESFRVQIVMVNSHGRWLGSQFKPL